MTAALTLEQAAQAIQRPLRWGLLGSIGLITLAHAVITWPTRGTYPSGLVDLVHVDREHNLPTWFSSSEFLLLALTFFALVFHESVTRRRRLARAFWLLCAAACLFLSLDETAELHEQAGAVAGHLFRTAEPGSLRFYLSTFPSYYWALVYVPVAVPCALIFSWFALKEMVGTRVLAISGLVLFGLGAVVLDHLEGRFGNSAHEMVQIVVGEQAYRFDVFLIEELLEMLGVFLVIEAAFRHLLRALREHPPVSRLEG